MNGNINKSWMQGFIPQSTTFNNNMYSTVQHSLNNGYYYPFHSNYNHGPITTGFSTRLPPSQYQNYHTNINNMYYRSGYQQSRHNPNNTFQNYYQIPPAVVAAPPPVLLVPTTTNQVNTTKQHNNRSHQNNNDGLINGIKNIVNGIMNPQLKCDFYADHQHNHRPKYRNNWRKYNKNDTTNHSRQQQKTPQQKSVEAEPPTLVLNISMSASPQILCNAQFPMPKTNTNEKSMASASSSSPNKPKMTTATAADPAAEVIAIFTNEDFPELPAPKHQTCAWDIKPKETVSSASCSIINFNSSSKKNKKNIHKNSSKIESKTTHEEENHRKESECDSEDSFIIFTNHTPTDYINCNFGHTITATTPTAATATAKNQQPKLQGCKSTAGVTPYRPKTKQRQISECSDDSFVICFTNDAPEGILEYSDYSFSSSSSDEDEDGDETDTEEDADTDTDDDETFVIEMHEKTDEILSENNNNNHDCNSLSSDSHPPSQLDSGFDETKEKKVRFNLKPEVHVIHAWNFAYRAARKGHWEDYARDRSRFKNRVEKLSAIISPILDNKHRENIYTLRFCDKLK